MARGCRDCRRCTESRLRGCLAGPWRVVFGFLAWPWRVLQRRCPHCGHPLAWHSRLRNGRFQD